MTTPPEIPEAVSRFIAERIDTVPHLETLLLLWEAAGRKWTEEEVATRLYVSVDTARVILRDLLRLNMIKSTADVPALYAFDPDWDETDQIMPRIAAIYARRVVAIASLIHSKASPAIREFARAFKLRD
jgi:hypothetical protein